MSKLKLEDLRPEGSDYEISLSKLTGVKIADIYGYITDEFGFPVFKITRFIQEDGNYFHIEGEHDMPYIPQGADDAMPNNMDEETLQDLYDQEEE